MRMSGKRGGEREGGRLLAAGRMGRAIRRTAAVLMLGLGLAGVVAAASPVGSRLDESVDAAGAAALEQAAAAKRAAYQLEGDAREQALIEVAGAYGAVADTESYGAAARGEAAFRAGEILRARGRPEPARERFLQATRLGGVEGDERAREFASRGILERAHMERREDRSEAALALYAEIATRFPDQVRQCAHGATWTAKLLIAEGRLPEAGEVVAAFASRFPDYPLEAIRNTDSLAVALVESGAEDKAQEALSVLQRQMEPVLAAGGKLADQVRDALGALRVNVLLSGY